jgi:hypothetical protein
MLTEAEEDVLADYVRHVASELQLRDWAFTLSRDEPDSSDAQASVEPTYGQKHAMIYLRHDFRALRPERQRHCLVHELVHCHLAPVCDLIRLGLTPVLGALFTAAIWEPFRQQIEYATDALASALAKHLPLIDWPGLAGESAELAPSAAEPAVAPPWGSPRSGRGPMAGLRAEHPDLGDR